LIAGCIRRPCTLWYCLWLLICILLVLDKENPAIGWAQIVVITIFLLFSLTFVLSWLRLCLKDYPTGWASPPASYTNTLFVLYQINSHRSLSSLSFLSFGWLLRFLLFSSLELASWLCLVDCCCFWAASWWATRGTYGGVYWALSQLFPIVNCLDRIDMGLFFHLPPIIPEVLVEKCLRTLSQRPPCIKVKAA